MDEAKKKQMALKLRENGGEYTMDLGELKERQKNGWAVAGQIFRVARVAHQDAGLIRVKFNIYGVKSWEIDTGLELVDIFNNAQQACQDKTAWDLKVDNEGDFMSFKISDHSFADELIKKYDI